MRKTKARRLFVLQTVLHLNSLKGIYRAPIYPTFLHHGINRSQRRARARARARRGSQRRDARDDERQRQSLESLHRQGRLTTTRVTLARHYRKRRVVFDLIPFNHGKHVSATRRSCATSTRSNYFIDKIRLAAVNSSRRERKCIVA